MKLTFNINGKLQRCGVTYKSDAAATAAAAPRWMYNELDGPSDSAANSKRLPF